MARNLTPCTVWGIEFDALINETKTLTSSIPTYPVESGFSVSDTIINQPVQVSMTLYLSNTPVTWLYRHGNANDRVRYICDLIERMWFEKKLTKIVTSDAIYTNMGITSISIKKSSELGYSREISISAQQVRTTQRKVVNIPDYILRSGETMANAGTASTSSESAKETSSTSAAAVSSNEVSSTSAVSGNEVKSSSETKAKKNQSILYGAAKGLKLIK